MTDTAGSNTLTDQNILVTGGAGFIGHHLVETLVAENSVTVLDDLSSGGAERLPSAATLIEGDIRDESTLDQVVPTVDLIFHQAGMVSVEQSIEEPARSHSINAGGTVKLLDAARRADARVVTASSAAIYGDPTTVPVPETEPFAPRSPYGIDKLAIDQYTQRFADLYGLDTVTLRYFNVYGPGQSAASYSGVISTFLEQAKADSPLTIHGDGSQTRDFIHVRDVVSANIAAATTNSVGSAFNIGTGQETSIAELAEIVRTASDTDPPITHVDGRTGDVRRSCADIRRAREQLEFEPTVALDDGLTALVSHPTKLQPESGQFTCQ